MVVSPGTPSTDPILCTVEQLGAWRWIPLFVVGIWAETNWSYKGRRANPYDEEHRVLYQAIRKGEPINSGDHMANATLATVMGQLSCYSGREVTWAKALKSNFFYPPMPDDCSFDMKPPVQLGKDGSYPVRVPGKTRIL